MGAQKSKLSRNDIKILLHETYFDKNELQQSYLEFIACFPTGTLNECEFVEMYQEYYPLGDPSNFAMILFQVFDQNSDGCISFYEFIKALSITCRGSEEEKLKWAFHAYDVDQDGYVTKEEMIFLLRSISSISNIQWHWEMAAILKDNLTIEKQVDEIFERLDLNGNGKLTLNEFSKGYEMYPWLLQVLTFDRFNGGTGLL